MSDKTDECTILFWCDLETTGLDEKNGRILEYAIVFTDLELNELTCMESIVKQDIVEAHEFMDDYVIEMHEKNSLLDEIASAGPGAGVGYKNQIKISEAAIVTVLKSLQDEDTIFVIAGSTVGFDRRWIKEHMPLVEKQLHYRQLDVSTYKVGFPEAFGTATSEAHRAMADIRASIVTQQKMRRIVEFAAASDDQLAYD